MKLLKENEKGRTHQTDDFKILYRNAGSISGDNAENPKERIYLITGSAIVTIDDFTSAFEAPAYFEIPKKTSHKIEALTDIGLILFD